MLERVSEGPSTVSRFYVQLPAITAWSDCQIANSAATKRREKSSFSYGVSKVVLDGPFVTSGGSTLDNISEIIIATSPAFLGRAVTQPTLAWFNFGNGVVHDIRHGPHPAAIARKRSR